MELDPEDARTLVRWYSRLLATTRDAVVCIDRDSRIVLFNAAAEQMFGYPAEDVLGQKVEKLMAEPYAHEHDGYVERYERTGEAHAIGRIRSVAARRANGEVFPIELSVTEVHIGERARYGAFIRDISEKVSLQERVLERERMAAIGATAASFAHEIGNPLNNMTMQVSLLERRLSRLEPQIDVKIRDGLDALLGEARRLGNLLGEFRALARRQPVSTTTTDFAELVGELLRAETPALNARGIMVTHEFPPKRRPSALDEDKLRHVLLNLIKNAADAMHDGGQLHVRVLEDDDQTRLEVSDTGGGIPEDVDVFEPFVTTKPERAGLGLTVAMQIVQAHGGSIHHQPALPAGTTFIVELPRRSRTTPARPPSGEGQP